MFLRFLCTASFLQILKCPYLPVIRSEIIKMKEHILLSEYKLNSMELKNRIVMSPMTRCRAIGNIPNELMAQYYKQRSGAGLIITEGTSPSPNGLGDLVAFGRSFINNPDLVDRFKKNLSLSKDLKRELFYTADEKGYTDYPVYNTTVALSHGI